MRDAFACLRTSAACFQGGALRDAVKPAGNRAGRLNGGGSADQDEKCGLKRVFGVLFVAEDTVADAEDHGTVAAHEDRERPLVALLDEAAQKVAVGKR